MKVTKELQDLRERGIEQLQAELKEARNRLFQDRVRFATRNLDNSNPLRAGKKRVARILTLIREAELKEQAATGTVKARRKRP
jgi:large subunit ribosomal protein L29